MKTYNKLLLFLIFILMLSSCGLYRYEYNEDIREIISKKGNNINTIWINDVNDNFIVSYNKKSAIDTRKIKIDSLNKYFECNLGNCDFYFKNGENYKITISPSGDRALQPIIINY